MKRGIVRGFIEKDRRIYPFRACKCWACNYPYNRGVVSKLEPLKWFNSAWIGPGICEDVYTWGVVEWVFNHGILEPSNGSTVRVEHSPATQHRLFSRDHSLYLTPPSVWEFCDLLQLIDISLSLIFYSCMWLENWSQFSVELIHCSLSGSIVKHEQSTEDKDLNLGVLVPELYLPFLLNVCTACWTWVFTFSNTEWEPRPCFLFVSEKSRVVSHYHRECYENSVLSFCLVSFTLGMEQSPDFYNL